MKQWKNNIQPFYSQSVTTDDDEHYGTFTKEYKFAKENYENLVHVRTVYTRPFFSSSALLLWWEGPRNKANGFVAKV